VESFLKQIQDELVQHTYQPMRVRKKEIPQDGGTTKPKKLKVAGFFPCFLAFLAAYRPNSISRVFSGCNPSYRRSRFTENKGDRAKILRSDPSRNSCEVSTSCSRGCKRHSRLPEMLPGAIVPGSRSNDEGAELLLIC